MALILLVVPVLMICHDRVDGILGRFPDCLRCKRADSQHGAPV